MRKIFKITGITLAGLIASTSLIACSSEEKKVNTTETTISVDDTSESNTENNTANTEDFTITETVVYKATKSINRDKDAEELYKDDPELLEKQLEDNKYVVTLNPDGTGKSSISVVDNKEHDVEWRIEEGKFMMDEIVQTSTSSFPLHLEGSISKDNINVTFETSNVEFVYERVQ